MNKNKKTASFNFQSAKEQEGNLLQLASKAKLNMINFPLSLLEDASVNLKVKKA